MLKHRNLLGLLLGKNTGAYINLSSEIGGRALIGAWALKGTNTVSKYAIFEVLLIFMTM